MLSYNIIMLQKATCTLTDWQSQIDGYPLVRQKLYDYKFCRLGNFHVPTFYGKQRRQIFNYCGLPNQRKKVFSNVLFMHTHTYRFWVNSHHTETWYMYRYVRQWNHTCNMIQLPVKCWFLKNKLEKHTQAHTFWVNQQHHRDDLVSFTREIQLCIWYYIKETTN